ncbi:Di-copper centre-containing protein [Pholiota conissans]|uniref:Di-copper centre-containing protein n=1 Tax=Pholiota conissans TaxID=109636 RepID=A0A9P6CTZ2_9AGAR|nr:Di-copper centre-containing protein [Pholiota conissans]
MPLIRFPFVTFILAIFFISVFAASEHVDQQGQKLCKNLHQRHEWRTLTDTQKADYIKAVKCLQAHPAKDPVYPESKTRFDEFQGWHVDQADYVHLVGQFLGWHRHFLQLYENALRNECGYEGYSPYWDWTQDADSTSSIMGSPVFDPITGFGGDGVPGTYVVPPNIPADQLVFPEDFRGCVQDGPFANYTVTLGPGKLKTTHCLTRGISNENAQYLTSKALANITSQPTFALFRVQLEGRPITPTPRIHDGGHFAVGGEMSNFYSSPADPLFFLHHANIDRVWWNWQQMLPERLYEIAGSSTYPPTVNVTLDQPLEMPKSFGETVPLWKVMNIHSEYNCYTYV